MWMAQLAVVLAIPLSLFGVVWGAIRIIQWVKAHRAHAAMGGVGLYLDERFESFRGWLGDWIDGVAESGGVHGTNSCDASEDSPGSDARAGDDVNCP